MYIDPVIIMLGVLASAGAFIIMFARHSSIYEKSLDGQRELKMLIRERDFFEGCLNAINEWRHKLPEQEQKEICEILADRKVWREASNEKFRAYQ